MFKEILPQRNFKMRVTTITVRATDITAASTTPPMIAVVIVESEAEESVLVVVVLVVVMGLGSVVDFSVVTGCVGNI